MTLTSWLMLSGDITLFRRRTLFFYSILIIQYILLYENIWFSSAENEIFFNHTEEWSCPDRPHMAWLGMGRMFVFIQYWRGNWHSHLPHEKSASDMGQFYSPLARRCSTLTAGPGHIQSIAFQIYFVEHFHVISMLLPCCFCYKSSAHFRCMLYAPFRRLSISDACFMLLW